MKQQNNSKLIKVFKYLTMKSRHKNLNMLNWTSYTFYRRTTIPIMLPILFFIIISPYMVNCELSETSRQFQSQYKLRSAENRYIRASSNLPSNARERPFLFPRRKNVANFETSGDKSTSHIITFPTSSEKTLQNHKTIGTNKRSPKQNAVKITQNYSVLNIFNASHPGMKDSSKLKDTELIEYLNYLHQLPPEDAAEAQQPEKIISLEKQDKDQTMQSQLQSLFDTEKATRTTESPIETLNKLRQKVVVKTTLKPLSQYPESNLKGNSNSQNTPRGEPQPRTESPLEILKKVKEKLSPLLTTRAPESKQSNTTFSLDETEITTFSPPQNNAKHSIKENSSSSNTALPVMNQSEESKEDELLGSNSNLGIKQDGEKFAKSTNKTVLKPIDTFLLNNDTNIQLTSSNTTLESDSQDEALQTNVTSSVQTATHKPIRNSSENNDPISIQFHSPVTKSLETTSNINSMGIQKEENAKDDVLDTTKDVSMIPILQPNNLNLDSKFKLSETINTTRASNATEPAKKENDKGKSNANSANVVHNFESIEIGVAVGVAIGVFIVFICFGSVMLCLRCGQRRGRRKESNLVTATGDCGNVGCSGNSSSGGFFFGGKRNVYNTMEHANGEPGSGENQLGYTSVYPTSGYFRKHGPPIMLTNELIMNYDDGNSENLSSIQGSQQSIELSCSYSNPIDLSKRSKSDKVTEL